MRQVLSLVLSVAVAVASMLSTSVRAQTPQATPRPLGTIVTMPVDQLPGPHTEVWFLRFTLQPGAALPGNEQAGPTLFVPESGEFTVTSDQSLTAASRSGTVAPLAAGVTAVSADGELVALLAPDRARLSVRNEGAEPASVLVLLLMSGEREVEVMQTQEAAAVSPAPETGPADSVTSVGLAIGRAEFGAGPGTITIERISIDAGAASTTVVGAAVEAGTIESGTVDYNVNNGTGFIWPGMAGGTNRGPDPVELRSGVSGQMSVDDGYFFGTGTAASITATGGPAVILRAIVTEQTVATPVP